MVKKILRKMNWKKSECFFKANNQKSWMISHSAMPIPLCLGGDLYRIYFSTRGERNNPQVGFIEIEINNPSEILNISELPCITNGSESYFDYNGVYSGCIIKREEELWMYYSGRHNGEGQLYHVSAGLAISTDGGLHFKKHSDSPIFQRNIHDPWLVSTPFVIKTEKEWRMWYLSGREVFYENGILAPYYDIRSAISENGLNWMSENKVHLGTKNGFRNVASPSIFSYNGYSWMVFSYIKDKIRSYQLGMARSKDLENWEVLENVFDSIPRDNWDQNRAYPNAFIHKNKLHILFCGNEFGRDGMGFIHTELENLKLI